MRRQLASLIRRGRRTTAAQGQQGHVVHGDQLQRIHAANQRLGSETELLVNPAPSLLGQEHAPPVVALSQPIPSPKNALPDDRRDALIVRMLVPLLAAQPLQIVVVQRNHGAAAALAAAGAIPAFDDRQGFDRQSQIAHSYSGQGVIHDLLSLAYDGVQVGFVLENSPHKSCRCSQCRKGGPRTNRWRSRLSGRRWRRCCPGHGSAWP